MFYGRAIIATDVGGVSEAIENGVDGILVPAEDPAALAAALGTLIRDRTQLSRLGGAARGSFADRHMGELFASRFVGLVRQVLAAHDDTDRTSFGAGSSFVGATARSGAVHTQ